MRGTVEATTQQGKARMWCAIYHDCVCGQQQKLYVSGVPSLHGRVLNCPRHHCLTPNFNKRRKIKNNLHLYAYACTLC
jgi:hypothetical protein